MPEEELLPAAEKLLEIPAEILRDALHQELREKIVVADTIDGQRCIFLNHLWNAEKVVAALQSADEVDTLLGKGHFTGAEMWGVDNMVATPVPINEHRSGVKRVQQVADFAEWFEPRKAQIIEHVRSKGMMFDQR